VCVEKKREQENNKSLVKGLGEEEREFEDEKGMWIIEGGRTSAVSLMIIVSFVCSLFPFFRSIRHPFHAPLRCSSRVVPHFIFGSIHSLYCDGMSGGNTHVCVCCDKMIPTIRPYKPRASAKMRINTIGTNNFG